MTDAERNELVERIESTIPNVARSHYISAYGAITIIEELGYEIVNVAHLTDEQIREKYPSHLYGNLGTGPLCVKLNSPSTPPS